MGEAWIDGRTAKCEGTAASGVDLNLVRGKRSGSLRDKSFATPRSELCLLRAFAGLGSLSLLLAGCAQRPAGDGSAAAPVASFRVHGTAYGGQQPVSDATIQLYAVGTAGDGSAATPLLTQAVTSDANGEFTLSGYTCPTPSTLVYLTATGGNPGLPNGLTNPQLALMAALGACGTLGPTTTINVNELTTVAAVWPLAPFMSSYSAIGSGSSDATALASAFATAAILANTSTGTVPGLSVPSGTSVPVTQIYTLADALASCINSAGGVAGDGSACGILFAAATPPGGTAPVNVISAGVDLANNPTLDSSSLFSLVGGKGPFQPTLTSAPANLAVQLTSTSGGLSYSASALVFPAAHLGFPAIQSFTVTNNGPLAVAFTDLQIVGANASDFSPQATCPGSPGLPVGQTCAITIGFSPSAGGVRNATVLVETSGVNSPQSVALSGIGLPRVGSSVTLSPSSLTFTLADVPQAVTVTNNGAMPITLGPISITNGNNDIFGLQTNNCGAMLAAQSICTIEVEAKFVNTGPPYTDTLQVIDSGNPGVETIPFTLATASANFTPSPINFGDVALNVTSKSNGSNVAQAGSYYDPAPPFSGSITGPNASDFNVIFPPSGFQTFAYVSFTPSGLGARTATLVTNYGNIALSGNGVPNSASFSITPVPPVSSQVGVSVPVPVTIQNTGSTVLYLYFSVGGDFVLPGTLASALVLVPAQSQSFDLTYTPSELGSLSATLTATDSGSGVHHSIPLTGTADSIDPAITPGVFPTFSNTEVGVLSAAQTFMVSTPSGGPVSFQSYNYGNNADFPLNPGTCAIQTPCQVSISFKPSKTGSENASYLVTDLVTAQTTILTAFGSGGVGSVSLSSSSLTFAARDIGTTSFSQTVTLTNPGDAAISIFGVTFAGANVGDFPIEANTCGSSLAAGANCKLTISFDPTASGARSALLQIMTNAASSPDNIQLMGTGN